MFEPRAFSRRALLAGSAGLVGAAALGGCTPKPSAGTPADIKALTSADPFYIAHRGGGGDWPEMTSYAYAQSSTIPGITALEISVCISSDGVLVCSHDPTTARLTGANYTIAQQTWQTLSQLKVSAAETVKPKQSAQPFTRFDDVVDAYIGRFVLFVEPKVSAAAQPLMVRMDALGQPQRVIWKQPINSALFGSAKQRGFTTWGYVLEEDAHTGDNLTRLSASADIDLLGVPQGAPETLISEVVAAGKTNGKKTIAWPIRTVDDRAKVGRLGVTGMMTSNPVEVLQVRR